MRIAIAADHNGVALKAGLITWLRAQGHQVEDRGTDSDALVVDYPLLCADICRRVVDGQVDRAIMVGGSGMGETVACNKVRGIRAGLCTDLFHARISRANNDANVLVLGAKVLAAEQAREITELWLDTRFTGGPHQRRLDQIAALERGEPLG
ncbi:RpiB/LacA/LacB family sugar-phosphate isomerase [Modestobacter marinus]|uniref:RpiB/LacA/LacB family sugar-phosphate isomerase n=1 Tax=Modestobacter marinus TaxID=477641 RepID=UPI00201A8D7F|nr:RpiB/LacA/LacB family sugar-phosphate isomerase [Modestobacter marinus]